MTGEPTDAAPIDAAVDRRGAVITAAPTPAPIAVPATSAGGGGHPRARGGRRERRRGRGSTPAIAVRARRRSLAIVAGLARLLRFALVLALVRRRRRPRLPDVPDVRAAPDRAVADPATTGNLPAPVVREFIAAVGRNDADAIRSAVPADPYKASRPR